MGPGYGQLFPGEDRGEIPASNPLIFPKTQGQGEMRLGTGLRTIPSYL